MTHRYAIIDTDSGETVRYVDSKVNPPAGCKIVPTGYKRPSAYEKAVKAAALVGECEFPF